MQRLWWMEYSVAVYSCEIDYHTIIFDLLILQQLNQIDLGILPPGGAYCQAHVYDQNNQAILLHPFRTTDFTTVLILFNKAIIDV